jgi:hypothetical protein
MAVIDGPGGPIAAKDADTDEAFARIAAHSPEAARQVLIVLTDRLRERDLTIVGHWSDDLDEQLLD